MKRQRQSLNVKNRCICRNRTCQSRIVCEIAKYIVAEDKDSTKAVIDKIKESYDKDVQAGVTERLKGKTPN